MEAVDYQRIRITFGKMGPARWTGHLDVARTWERALNRAKVPMAYTQGFNRRPRMQFASALPLGYTSQSEVVDLWLRENSEPTEILARLQDKMAPGIEVKTAHEVPRKQPALPVLTVEARYEARLRFIDIDLPTLQERVATLEAAEAIEWEKAGRKNKGKMYDMRPLILGIEIVESDPLALKLHLKNVEGKTGRPGHVLGALGMDHLDAQIERTDLILSDASKV